MAQQDREHEIQAAAAHDLLAKERDDPGLGVKGMAQPLGLGLEQLVGAVNQSAQHPRNPVGDRFGVERPIRAEARLAFEPLPVPRAGGQFRVVGREQAILENARNQLHERVTVADLLEVALDHQAEKLLERQVQVQQFARPRSAVQARMDAAAGFGDFGG